MLSCRSANGHVMGRNVSVVRRRFVFLVLLALLLGMGYSSAAKSKKKGKDKKEDMQSTGIAGAKCSASDADSFDEILRAGSALFNRNFAAAEDCQYPSPLRVGSL